MKNRFPEPRQPPALHNRTFLKDGLRYSRLTRSHASSRSQQRIYQMFEQRCERLDTEATEGQHFQVIGP